MPRLRLACGVAQTLPRTIQRAFRRGGDKRRVNAAPARRRHSGWTPAGPLSRKTHTAEVKAVNAGCLPTVDIVVQRSRLTHQGECRAEGVSLDWAV